MSGACEAQIILELVMIISSPTTFLIPVGVLRLLIKENAMPLRCLDTSGYHGRALVVEPNAYSEWNSSYLWN